MTPRQITGIPFEQGFVALGKLTAHPAVQRAFQRAHAAKIASEFNEDALGTIWVNRKGREHQVFDGQHRVAAVKLYLGDGWEAVEVPCRLYRNLDDQTCAALTNGLNNGKAWKPIDKFTNDVVAGESVAVDITTMLRGHGLTVRPTASATTVRAVTTMRAIYGWKPDGRSVLDGALGILHEAWPEDANALDGEILRATALLLLKHGHVIERPALLHRLSARHSPDVLVGQGRSFAKATGVSIAHGILSTLVRAYNTGRRSGKLAEA